MQAQIVQYLRSLPQMADTTDDELRHFATALMAFMATR